MKIPWKSVLTVGKGVAGMFLPGAIISAINIVEENLGALKGPEKKAAAQTMAKSIVEALEAGAGKDVVNDPAVVAATGNFIDAYVSLMDAYTAVKAAKLKPAA